jgi:hypothetical protein
MALWDKLSYEETIKWWDQEKLGQIEVLTCSAADYAKNQNRGLTSYRLIGLNSGELASLEKAYNTLRMLAIKFGCSAIVDVRESMYVRTNGAEIIRVIGTGLILGKQDDEKRGGTD